MSTLIETPSAAAYKPPLSQRINFRMIIFVGVLLALIGTPVYIYLDSIISGGVHNRGDYLEVDLKAISTFPFDEKNGKITDIPKQWRELDGKRVVMDGEMWAPGSAAPRINKFDLCYSIAKCCFNGPPQVQHFVKSTVVNNGRVPYYSGLVRVTGTLHVDVKKDDSGKSPAFISWTSSGLSSLRFIAL
jgi:hypothetical protein